MTVHQLNLVRPWRYLRSAGRGVRDLNPGIYKIPDEIPLAAAEKAVEQGVGKIVEQAADAPREAKSLGSAPENRALFGAPEDKSLSLRRIEKAWDDICIVAASGPSLTPEVAEICRGHHVIAVNDAYRLLPFADVLYACDEKWWKTHKGCPGFAGEKWTSHGSASHNNKEKIALQYGLNVVHGKEEEGFSLNPSIIHYGSNSGFQGINVGIHKLGGKGRILLVAFDMRSIGVQKHFFGDHPKGLNNRGDYERFIPNFDRAAAALPEGLQIINCTPGSALKCFTMGDLAEELRKVA